MEWISVFILFGLTLYMPAGMLYVYFQAIRKGLIKRDKEAWEIRKEKDKLIILRGSSSEAICFKDILRARYALNSNWCESRFVEDAISIIDLKGRMLAKFPSSATGFDDAIQLLKVHGVKLERIEVEAPSYMD